MPKEEKENYVHISLTCLRMHISVSSELSERNEFSSTIFLPSSWLLWWVWEFNCHQTHFQWKKSNTSCITCIHGSNSGKLSSSSKWPKSLPFKYCLQLEIQKRGCWGQWFGTSKEQAGNRMEMEKQMLDKLISAGSDRERLVQNGLDL